MRYGNRCGKMRKERKPSSAQMNFLEWLCADEAIGGNMLFGASCGERVPRL